MIDLAIGMPDKDFTLVLGCNKENEYTVFNSIPINILIFERIGGEWDEGRRKTFCLLVFFLYCYIFTNVFLTS